MHNLLRLFLFGFGVGLSGHSLAIDCTGLDIWNSSEAYSGGHEVQHNNNAYRASWWTRNQNPETHSGPHQEWKLLGACDDGGGTNQPPRANANGPYAAGVNKSIAFSSAGSTDTDGNITGYSWNFGDGSTSSTGNPSHSYTTAGTYTVTLTVTDNDGASATASSAATITTGDPGNPGSCSGIPAYVAGTAYVAGQRVANFVDASGDTVEFVCNIAGWCSSPAAWAYEPGNGGHWEDAWSEVGRCDGGGGSNQAPVADANGPYAGEPGTTIAFNSNGSSDPDGTIAGYNWSFGDGATSSNANPGHSYANGGTYTVTLTVTDDDGASTTDSTIARVSGGGGGGPLPARIINGYWHNFANDAGFMPLRDVSPRFNVVNVSFAEPTTPTSGVMRFVPDGNTTDAAFRAGMQTLKSRGQKVLISIGGANGQVQLTTPGARNSFVTTMIDIIETYGFDGIDIDFEGHSLSFELGDEDFRNPTTPIIVNTISAIRQICDHFGPDFLLTMAPETFFVQLGYNFYGGISVGADRRAGAYLPVIHALRDRLTFLQVQHYNSGPILALDNQYHLPGDAKFHVAMIDMLLKGFPIAGDSSKFFPPLRQDQLLIGLPATALAGGGFTPVGEVQRALDCLVKAVNCPSYNPGRSYPNFRGLMTWSINWDKFNNFEFSSSHRRYLDALP